MNLAETLKSRLLEAKKIAVLGIGSEFRGDDAAGTMVVQQLERALRGPNPNFKVFNGATAPENLTGEIKKFKPEHLLIVDAADLGKPSGTVKIMDSDESRGISFCTHNLPIKIMADYLKESIGCRVSIIGVQPKELTFGVGLSNSVTRSVKEIVSAIKKNIKNGLKK